RQVQEQTEQARVSSASNAPSAEAPRHEHGEPSVTHHYYDPDSQQTITIQPGQMHPNNPQSVRQDVAAPEFAAGKTDPMAQHYDAMLSELRGKIDEAKGLVEWARDKLAHAAGDRDKVDAMQRVIDAKLRQIGGYEQSVAECEEQADKHRKAVEESQE